jgi:osmotically inducible protein OsmC
MVTRNAQAIWEGTLKEGRGTMSFGSGAFEGAYSYASRFEQGSGTNPEELIGAAHAGCYSMALSGDLGKAGFTPKRIFTQAHVYLGRVEGKSRITRIHLESEAEVPDIGREEFMKIAEATKTGCPVSAALTGVEITLEAHLIL